MTLLKVLAFLLLIAFGVFMVVFGEADDSPGAQGLGLVAAIGGVYGLVRMWRKKNHTS